jgi:serine/threonine-protein kinase RsbT
VDELSVAIEDSDDIVAARQQGRRLAERFGFSGVELTVIATAISEVARNIVMYAEGGQILLSPVERGGRRGLMVVARDHGPGIADVTVSMRDGYSTSGGLGLGLPGTKRLMDEFEIESEVPSGTTVTMRKWLA